MRGIDVSEHQGIIDFRKVKQAGVEFAMVRLGSIGRPDKQAIRNIEGFLSVGIHVGVYEFCYVLDQEEARQDAAQVISMLKPFAGRIDFPVAYDLEASGYQIPGMMGSEEWAIHAGRPYTKESRTEIVRTFLHEIESAGYYAMTYLNADYYYNRYNIEKLKRYDMWMARPGDSAPNIPCGLWQYSWTGSIPGIYGNVDMNIAYKDYPSLIKQLGLNGHTKQEIKPAPKPEPEVNEAKGEPTADHPEGLLIPCQTKEEKEIVLAALKKVRII